MATSNCSFPAGEYNARNVDSQFIPAPLISTGRTLLASRQELHQLGGTPARVARKRDNSAGRTGRWPGRTRVGAYPSVGRRAVESLDYEMNSFSFTDCTFITIDLTQYSLICIYESAEKVRPT
jgi:hypothetical protein